MAASIFGDKTAEPTRSDLKEALAKNVSFLNAIEEYLMNQCEGLVTEWKFYGKQAGWTIAYRHKKRRILHLIPKSGHFEIVFVLGERAVDACRASNLPENVLQALEDARKYVEGKTFRLAILSPEDVEIVKQLILIKLSN